MGCTLLKSLKLFKIFPLSIFDAKQNNKDFDVLFLCAESHYTVKISEVWYSPIIGSWKLHCEEKGLKCKVFMKGYMTRPKNRYFDDVQTIYYYYLTNSILLRFLYFFPNFSNVCKKIRLSMIKSILKKHNVKKIMSIMPDADWCVAARDSGVEVIDLQHGVINSQHPWYGARYIEKRKKSELPTHFYVWNKASAEALLEWADAKTTVVEVHGNLWIDRFKKSSLDDTIVNQLRINSNFFRNSNPTILFTSQWSSRYDVSNVCPAWLIELIQKNSMQHNYLIKLHPTLLTSKKYPQVRKMLFENFSNLPNVDWVRTSSSALPALLCNVDIHLTVNSSVVIEAAEMGLKSGIVDPQIKSGGLRFEYFENEIASGAAEVLAESTDLICDWINRNIEKN